MGKRSDFARRERDFYPTPPEAVAPLVPHLDRSLRYFEPCAGDGALMRALPDLTWVPASDIEPRAPGILQMDAMDLRGVAADCILTNPPCDRSILHPMIAHFMALRPTWLLFDADWMHTRQSADFMPWCRKIVSVGRVKWIADSPHTGKDNCAWYLFDRRAGGATEFVGRAA